MLFRSLNFSKFGEQSFDFEYGGEKLENIVINLSGEHQILNAATALTALMVLRKTGFSIPNTTIYEGLKSVNWPGRLELVMCNPDVILDGAHNVSGAKSLANVLVKCFNDKKIVLVIGILKDKQIDEILSIICPHADVVVATMPDSPRALEPYVLAQMADKFCKHTIVVPDLPDAVQMGLSLASKNDVLLITGSLYLVGAVRKYFKSQIPC